METNQEKSIFNDAVATARMLLNDGNIYIDASPIEGVDIKVQIDKQSLEKSLKSTHFTYDDFKAFLKEISSIISACLEDREEYYINREVEFWRENDKYDDAKISMQKSLLESKYQAVKEQLIDDSLRYRYFFKKHAKSPYFVGCDWQVNTKHADSDTEMPKSLAYATCLIRYISPGKGIRFPFLPVTESIEIDCTGDEIEYIIRTLSVIKDKIKAVQQNIK